MNSITLKVKLFQNQEVVIISGCGYFKNIIVQDKNIPDAKKKFMDVLKYFIQIKEISQIKEQPLGPQEKYDTIKMEIKQIE